MSSESSTGVGTELVGVGTAETRVWHAAKSAMRRRRKSGRYFIR
jgi:hypothetical protein